MAKQNKGRKFFAASATAALVASAIVPVASAAAYSDEAKIASWAKDSVQYVTDAGYMQGSNGNFNPTGTFTRAEAATIATKVLGLDTSKSEYSKSFSDVKAGQWFFEEVGAAAEAGIVNGLGDGKFNPNGKLTRQDAAIILAKIYDLDVANADVKVLDKFSDKGSIASYATKHLAALVEADVIKGSNGKINPKGDISRQELAVMLSKADQTFMITLAEALAELETAVKALPAVASITAENAAAAQTKVDAAKEAIETAEYVLGELKADSTAEEIAAAEKAIADAKTAVAAVEAAIEATKPVTVTGVSAINATELAVTVNNPKAELKIADLAVKVNDADATFTVTKKSDTEYRLFLVVPLQNDAKVTVAGVDKVKGSVSTTYKTTEVKEVEALATTVYSNEDGQVLKLKVNGKETTASELAKDGYTVSFRATENVFGAAVATSQTGLLDKAALTTLIGTKHSFKYNVTITKDNKTVASDYVSVAVYDKTKTGAKTINSTNLALLNGTSGGTVTTATVSSNTLVAGEFAQIDSVTADLLDGRKDVELTDATLAGLVQYASDDVTIATVSATGEIEAKRAGTVKITVQSGDAKKEITLKVVPASQKRELTSVSYTGGQVKLVANGGTTKVGIVAKDQYGDTVKLAATSDIQVQAAVANGKEIANAVVDGLTDKKGYTTITVTPDAANTGSGNITLKSGSKTLAVVPVAVTSVTSADTKQVELSVSKIDLNGANSKEDDITIRFGQYYNGHFNKYLDMNGYEVVIKDADGFEIYRESLGATTNDITFSRADLIKDVKITAKTSLNGADSSILAADAAKLENFETGRGEVLIYDAQGLLVSSKNFDIVDTTATISNATFAPNINFTALNAANLKLSELLPTVNTTAAPYDGVLRYEVVAGTNDDEIIAYYSSSAAPAAFSYEDGDILVGKIIASPIAPAATGDFNFSAVTAATSVEVLLNSATLAEDEKVQFNVYKRGDVSVAKTVIFKK